MRARLLVLAPGLKRHGSDVPHLLRNLLAPFRGAAGVRLVDPHRQEELESRLILKETALRHAFHAKNRLSDLISASKETKT